ncbi:NAD(P)/FAD-dependent oxidoreductase [Nocardiopsis sp. NRRL B-16309]|uniref:NAD(P)/FAD-dependent oxidoreductase n=1 Tax=Nocardiopsis sp. NRRL B-16309 TaxID=1519494 RepID=UPI0006AFAACD|nr:FAD-dependent oxidoreductase [Nocardiopsis sp. NRRL B-16309]KOX12415.1 amine oxidase [Nocardiopsis sp. NRRL B-16309]
MVTGHTVHRRRRIAVIGSGVAGLTAAHVLRRHADVTLLEARDRLGGHAHTHRVAAAGGGELSVDSGFIVHNRRTYPHLLRLFRELGVPTRSTEMSMSVGCDGCGLEYAGARGLSALLPSRSRRSTAYLRMLAEVPRFHRVARRLLDTGPPSPAREPTLADVVRHHRFDRYFVAHFLLPLVSAVWSCPPGTALDYPARYLFAFLRHHGMLSVWGSPSWRTVEGGSRVYVERVAASLASVRTGAPVTALARTAHGVRLRAGSEELEFDAAVVATHADQALALLESPAPVEKEVLGAFAYSRNRTLLHTDTSVLPRDRATWASWNHRLSSCEPDDAPVRVSYHMNRLQHLAGDEQYAVTLNDGGAVDPGRVVAAMDYAHPVYTPASVAAQRRLGELNDGVVAFAGAHHGWGFHEDGCRSGAVAAASLGVRW